MARGRFRRSLRLSEDAPDGERDVSDEIGFYLEMRARELIAQGVAPEDARRMARERFGDPGRIAAECEDIARAASRRRRLGWLLDSVAQDVRFAARGMMRSPLFALTSILALAIGIGGNTAVFALIDAALLRAPEVWRPDRLAAIYTTCRNGDPQCSSSYPDFVDYDARSRLFEGMAAHTPVQVALSDDAATEVVEAELVTGSYFGLLGIRMALGRALQPADDDPAADHALAVISSSTWRTRFGADPRVVGRRVRVNGTEHTIVGVAPSGFRGLRLGGEPAVWLPMRDMPAVVDMPGGGSALESRAMRWINGLVGRLARDATLEAARTEMLGISSQLVAEDSAARGARSVTVAALPRYAVADESATVIASFLVVLQGVVALTLLLTCANLANLLLARAAARRREMGIRFALGAGRGRLLRQLLIESTVLAIAGGLAGLLLAAVALRSVGGFELPFGFDVAALRPGVGLRVVGFAFCVTMLAAVLAGVLPALDGRRSVAAAVIGRPSGDGGPRAGRLRGALVAAQVAISAVVLVGAGLFVRTLQDRLRIDLGFPVDGLAIVTVNPAMSGYGGARLQPLAHDLTGRVRGLPGVRSAAVGARVPVQQFGTGTFVEVDGYAPAADEEMRVDFTHVGPDYFATIGLPIVRGREFDAADSGSNIVVINETMARRWWAGREALGGTIRLGRADYRVVGIVRNTAWERLEVGESPFVFLPLARSPGQFTIVARAGDEARAIAQIEAMRTLIRSTEPGLAVTASRTMRAELDTRLAPQRAAATLLSAFGAITLVLAALGIYGVVAFNVGRRRRDYGIRLALGALPRGVVGLAAREMIVPVGIGLVAGVAAAIALARGFASFVLAVPPNDPAAFAGAAGLLAVVAAAASLLPARRASRIDPLDAIRSD